MDAEAIAHLRALLAAATPGPWEGFCAHHRTLGTVYGATTAPDASRDRDVFVDHGATPADVELIVAAVNTLPALLDHFEKDITNPEYRRVVYRDELTGEPT